MSLFFLPVYRQHRSRSKKRPLFFGFSCLVTPTHRHILADRECALTSIIDRGL